MRLAAAICMVLAPAASVRAAAPVWELETATLRYAVTHPLHHVEGVSTAAKGKGRADATRLRFLVAVPVRSFDSGDSNRDSHMLEVTRAALHPMIAVRIAVPLAAAGMTSGTVAVEAVVEFAGTTVTWSSLNLFVSPVGADRLRVTGVLPLSLKAFAIAPPSLLAMPVDDTVPVRLDLVWKKPPG